MKAAQITEANAALNFMFGGKATFTLRSKKTGAHIGFKINKAKDGAVYFVKARRNVEADEGTEGGFNYLGYVKGKASPIKTSAKSKDCGNALEALKWTLANLASDRFPEQLEVWHEGRCCRCNRQLTDPESIALGIGPECRKKG